MDGRLQGKTAIVTGSTKGIGLGIARAYVREGARVIVNSRNAADCARTARELGPAAVPIAADLSLTDEVRRLAREARQAFAGRVDILVIHVSSMNGTVPFPHRLAYCVSKAGLNMMTKVMAIEWAVRGVRVNAIAPGYVETEFITSLSATGILDRDKLARRTPMGRIGTPEKIGEVAVFLASPASSFITGEILTADGGWSAYGDL